MSILPRNNITVSLEQSGDSDCNPQGANELILWLPSVYVPQHFGPVCKIFGNPDEYRFETDEGLKQANWTERGLYINYEYLNDKQGIANLLVVIIKDEAKEQYLRILERISRRPIRIIQGVFA